MKAKVLLSTLFPTAILSAALIGCSTDATSPVRRMPTASFAALTGLPAPELQSAVIVGGDKVFSLVRLTYNDTADNEAMVHAYFTADDGSVMTQNIGGVAGTGLRVVDVYAPKNVATVKINFMFNDPGTDAICKCTFGPYSASLIPTTGTGTPTSGKAKGHK